MPSSSDRQRDLMTKWFGNCDTSGPEAFLVSHGFELTRRWMWLPPVPAHNLSNDEKECIIFLIEEWDYGGVASS